MLNATEIHVPCKTKQNRKCKFSSKLHAASKQRGILSTRYECPVKASKETPGLDKNTAFFQLTDVCKYSPTVFSCKDCVLVWTQKDNTNSRNISWWQKYLHREDSAGRIEEEVSLFLIILAGTFRLCYFEAKCTYGEKVLWALGVLSEEEAKMIIASTVALTCPQQQCFSETRGRYFSPRSHSFCLQSHPPIVCLQCAL